MVKGINDIPTTAPWMIKYFPGGKDEASNYTRSCSRKFTPICPFCGRLSDTQISPNRLDRLHGISCICKDGISMPNKLIRGLMEQALNLGLISKYEKEYKETDIHGTVRRFDMLFYDLNNRPYFVEMDGGRHGYIMKKHSTEKWTILPAKLFFSDYMKDIIAEKMDIPLIRIDCFKSNVDYIKNNIYKSDLKSVINLDRIDWMQLEDLCFGNIMKDICDYKRNNPELFTPQIAEKFGVSSGSVRDYLKRGTKLGLCYYNPSKEFERSNALPRKKSNAIKVYVENLNNGETWNFNSITELCQSSYFIFDEHFFSKKMWENRFNKTDKDYIIYEDDDLECSYIIWRIGGS